MIITAIDTETTGLDRSKHEIIEIAVVRYIVNREGGTHILSELNKKIKPRHIETASKMALAMNHYSEEAWKDAVDISEVLPEIERLIGDSTILLGQNLIFDLRYISDAFENNGYEIPEYPAYTDTKAIADVLKFSKEIKRSSLDYLCEHFDIKFSGKAHTALVDCKRTMKVWECLVKRVGDYSFYSYSDPYEVRYDR